LKKKLYLKLRGSRTRKNLVIFKPITKKNQKKLAAKKLVRSKKLAILKFPLKKIPNTKNRTYLLEPLSRRSR